MPLVHSHSRDSATARRPHASRPITWGASTGPPSPPTLGSAPAEPWRSSIPPTLGLVPGNAGRASMPPSLGRRSSGRLAAVGELGIEGHAAVHEEGLAVDV